MGETADYPAHERLEPGPSASPRDPAARRATAVGTAASGLSDEPISCPTEARPTELSGAAFSTTVSGRKRQKLDDSSATHARTGEAASTAPQARTEEADLMARLENDRPIPDVPSPVPEAGIASRTDVSEGESRPLDDLTSPLILRRVFDVCSDSKVAAHMRSEQRGPVVAEQNPLEADQASTPQTDAPIATLPVKKELDPSLECVICRGLLAVACSLACGHVFCWVCCDGWRAAKRDKPEGALCPTCRGSMTTSGRCVPLDHLAETMARDVLKDDPGELQEWEERKREGLERARRAQAEAVAKARAAEDDGVSDDEGSEDDNSEDNDDDDDEDGDESSDEDSLGSNEGSGDEDDEEDTSQEDR
eukprot:gene2383-3111_t